MMNKTKLLVLTFFLTELFLWPFAIHSQGINIGSSGNMTITGAATIQIDNGGLVNNGTYITGAETVTFSGNTAREISGSSNTVMNNLSITNSGGLTTQLTLLTAANLTIGAGSKFTIPTGKAVTVTAALTNNAGSANLVLESGSETSNSSLIQPSSVLATSKRFMTSGKWHIMSFPVSGQDIGDFLAIPGNSIATSVSGYGMAQYDPTNNIWGSFFTSGTAGNFGVGTGYIVRRIASTDGAVTSAGTLQTGTVALSGLIGGKWNCIGNPYTSAVSVTSGSDLAADFLNTNSAKLDVSYGAIYVWVEQALYEGPARSDYKVISNNNYAPELTKTDLQVGQGFLVKMAAGETTLSFTAAMQSHLISEPYLKKSASSWPGFDLVATSATLSINTIVTFNEAMTAGLDPTYDAGVLKGNPKLALYTKLIEDNGTGFAIQCLPLSGIDNFVIPVGIDFPAGGEINFTAKTELIPPGSTVILEDRANGTFTNLVTNQSGYTVSLPSSTSGTGRFFLHTNDSQVNTPFFEKESIQVYSSGKNIYINGEIPGAAAIYLYSTQGALMRTYSPQSSEKLQLDADGLNGGIYLLKIKDKMGVKTYKLHIEHGL